MQDMSFLYTLTTILILQFTSTHGNKACYPPYECFTDDPPFNDALLQLPEHPNEVGTLFQYFTRRTRKIPALLNPTASRSPSRANFNPNVTTVFFTHGYLESRIRWYVPMMIDELLKREDMNVIFVEWANGATFPYHQAYGNARLVGAQISRMIEVIKNDTGINWEKLRLVGFSLGSHIMGYAGQHLKKRGLEVHRITALDPAAPYYEGKPKDAHIDKTDAKFVDVIHTDSKTLFVAGFGTTQRMGHVDFFPNGGYHQIGCGKVDIGVVQYLACSHYRSVRYWIESINNEGCPYYGYPCNSYKDFEGSRCTRCPDDGCPKMSYHITKPKKVVDMNYYLITHDEFPFCAFHYDMTFLTNKGYFADLNDEVTVKLIGSNGTDNVYLDHHYYDAGSRERRIGLGKIDIGELKKVEIQHSGLLDAWHLRAVSIRRMSSNDRYTACYNMWLNKANSESLVKDKNIDDCSIPS